MSLRDSDSKSPLDTSESSSSILSCLFFPLLSFHFCTTDMLMSSLTYKEGRIAVSSTSVLAPLAPSPSDLPYNGPLKQ